MAHNIKEFYRVARSRDFARQFQFRLTQLGDVPLPSDFLIYVEAATLPGKQINNVQVPFMGLNFNIPGTESFPNSGGYSVTFRCDQDYNIRRLLEDYMEFTFSHKNSTGNFNTPSAGSIIELELTGKTMAGGPGGGEPIEIRKYRMYGAYVQSLGDVNYTAGDNGAIVSFPVTLAYQFWEAEQINSEPTLPNF